MPPPTRLQSATVSRVADRWFVSLTVDTPDVSHLPQPQLSTIIPRSGLFRVRPEWLEEDYVFSTCYGWLGV